MKEKRISLINLKSIQIKAKAQMKQQRIVFFCFFLWFSRVPHWARLLLASVKHKNMGDCKWAGEENEVGEGESQQSSEMIQDTEGGKRKKTKKETATMVLNLLWACSPHNGNGKMHFHDSRWTFPLMVCKSLERQMSYFCGLNGSFDFFNAGEGK